MCEFIYLFKIWSNIIICRWSLIAGRLPGRTDNEIKNYWNTHIKRKLLSRGIDPNTHRTINESTIPLPKTAAFLLNDEHVKFGFAGPDEQRTIKPEPMVVDREEYNNKNNNNNCTSSGTTSEKDIETDDDYVLNLELSVGLATTTKSNRYESNRIGKWIWLSRVDSMVGIRVVRVSGWGVFVLSDRVS